MRRRRSQSLIPPEIYFAFQRIERVRPASADLAIEKARTAFVIADIMALRGGVPIRVNGEVVGAVGVAGLNKENDTEIANAAAAALSHH